MNYSYFLLEVNSNHRYKKGYFFHEQILKMHDCIFIFIFILQLIFWHQNEKNLGCMPLGFCYGFSYFIYLSYSRTFSLWYFCLWIVLLLGKMVLVVKCISALSKSIVCCDRPVKQKVYRFFMLNISTRSKAMTIISNYYYCSRSHIYHPTLLVRSPFKHF